MLPQTPPPDKNIPENSVNTVSVFRTMHAECLEQDCFVIFDVATSVRYLKGSVVWKSKKKAGSSNNNYVVVPCMK